MAGAGDRDGNRVQRQMHRRPRLLQRQLDALDQRILQQQKLRQLLRSRLEQPTGVLLQIVAYVLGDEAVVYRCV